jgi:DNA polymerase I
MLPSGQSTWSEIKEIVRHRTDKKIFRVGQKFGESVTTEDHSFMTWQDDKLVKANRGHAGRMLDTSGGDPPVRKVVTLDMYELLKGYSHETTLRAQ